MNAKKRQIKTRVETWADLLVCLVLIPCLVSVFPVNEWILWRASDVIVYLLWTYLCWYLGRHLVPALFDTHKRWTALAVVFIATVLTYLMSLKQVSFPREMIADRLSRQEGRAAGAGEGRTDGGAGRAVRRGRPGRPCRRR